MGRGWDERGDPRRRQQQQRGSFGRGGDGGGGEEGDWGGEFEAMPDRGPSDLDGDLIAAWGCLSGFLKGSCPGAEAWLLSGAPELTRGLGMRSFKKRSVTLGGVKAAWLGYEVRGPGGREEGTEGRQRGSGEK